MAGITGLLLPVSPLVAEAQLIDGLPSIGGGAVDFAERIATHLAIAYAATPNADARTLFDLLKHSRMSSSTRTTPAKQWPPTPRHWLATPI